MQHFFHVARLRLDLFDARLHRREFRVDRVNNGLLAFEATNARRGAALARPCFGLVA